MEEVKFDSVEKFWKNLQGEKKHFPTFFTPLK